MNQGWIFKKRYWIAASGLFLLLFVSFCYTMDTDSIIRYELSFGESILHGEFGNFWQRTYDMMQAIHPAYDALMNLVLGIWGIPLALYVRAAGIPDITDSILALLYGKGILLAALVFSVILIYKVCEALKMERERCLWAAYFYLTSLLVLTCVGIVGQTDVMGIVFSLLVLKAFIEEKQKKFLLFSALAFPFKMFSFFIFIPLLLLWEKKIYKLIPKILLIVLPNVILNLSILSCPEAAAFKTSFSIGIAAQILKQRLPLMGGTIPCFLFFWGILCLWCYLYKGFSAHRDDCAVFVPLAAMTILLTSFSGYCYWYLNVAPFVAIAVFHRSGDTGLLVQAETVGMGALTVSNLIRNYWCFDVQNCESMLFGKLLGHLRSSDFLTIGHLFGSGPLQYATIVTDTVFFLAMLLILWKCRPGREKTVHPFAQKSLPIRAAINHAVALIPLICYVAGKFI